ncbi:hypothetical protein GCM10009848_56270 [Micromonospora lupini]
MATGQGSPLPPDSWGSPTTGSWSAYARFRRWQRKGTRQRILTTLQALADAAGRITWDMFVTRPAPEPTAVNEWL